jgi:hypothetical protein
MFEEVDEGGFARAASADDEYIERRGIFTSSNLSSFSQMYSLPSAGEPTYSSGAIERADGTRCIAIASS